MSAPVIPNLNSPHAIVLIGTDGLPYAATGGGAGGAAISAGASSQNSGTVIFSNAGGVSFGLNAGVMTASVAAAGGAQTGISSIADSANTQTVGMLSFSNAHGVSFGLSTGASTATLTASVAAQSVQTQASGNIGATGFATTTIAGLVVAGTNNTAGFTLAVPPYITTYVAQTTQTQATGNIAATGFATTTTNGSVIVGTNNTTGFTLAVPPYLTTAMLSNASSTLAGTGTTFAGANVSGSMTLNSAGLDLSLSAGAGGGGGAALSNSQTYFSTGTINLLEGGGAITIASGANQSFLFSVPATSVLTGGANITVSSAGSTISIIGASAAAAPLYVTGTNGSSVSAQTLAFGAANGLTLGLSTGASAATVTGSYTVPTQSVQTQASGNLAGIGTTTTTQAGSTLGATLSTNGLSLAIPQWITTAAGGGGIALANSQTTYTSGTAWISEGGGAITIGSTANGASQSFTIAVPATSSLVGSNGISISSAGSTISIIGGSGIPYLSYFEPQQRAGQITFNASGSIVPASVYMQPFIAENFISAYRMMMLDSLSTAVSTLSYQKNISASSGTSTGAASGAHSYTAALFSRQSTGTDAHSASLLSFASVSWTRSWSYGVTTSYSTNVSTGTATISTNLSMGFISNIDSAGGFTTGSTSFSGSTSGSQTSTGVGSSSSSCSFTLNQVYMTGVRPLNLPFAVALTPGEYWLGLQYASTSGTTGTAVASGCMYTPMLGVLSTTATIMYPLGLSANNTNTTQAQQGLGTLSGGTTASTTTAFPITAISNRSGIQTWFNMMAASL